MDFTKKSCPVCSKRFASDDDIVVCPKCGAPYHRGCYEIKGACIFTDLHKKGETWHDKNEEHDIDTVEQTDDNSVICQSCGHKNSKDSIVCEKCGGFLPVSNNVSDSYSTDDDDEEDPFRMSSPVFRAKKIYVDDIRDFAIGIKKDDDFDGVTGEELMTYVGNNELYYGPIFSSIKKKNISRFNFATFLFQGIWYFHRKQYLIGTILGFLTVLPMVAQYFCYSYFKTNELWTQVQEAVASNGYASYRDYIAWIFTNCDVLHGIMMLLPLALSVVSFVVTIILAFRANRSYYKHAIKKIKSIKTKNSGKSEQDILEIIRNKGGINQGLSFMILACELIITVAFTM